MKPRFLLFLFTPFLALSQQEITLNQVISRVSEHSRELKIQQLSTEVQKEKVRDVAYSKLPDITFNVSADEASNFLIYDNGLFNSASKHEVIHTLYSSNTNFYLNLYEGFRVKNSKKYEKLKLKLLQENTVELAASQKLLAIQLFLDLYLQNQWKELIQQDVIDKQHQLKEIKDFYEVGTVLQSDVLRAELELSKRKMTLIEIENQQKKINQQLNVLLGYDDNLVLFPLAFIEKNPEYKTYDDELEIGIQQAYREKISHYEVEMAEKNYELIASADYPKIGLSGTYQFSNPQIFLYPYNDSWYSLGMIGLKVSYSLDNIYKNKHKKAGAKLEIEEKHQHHKKIQDDIRTQLYQDYINLDESVKRLSIYELNEKYAKENARILKDAYFNNTALITDLLDADIQLLKSKFELKQSKINIYKNYYQLQFSKGAL